MLLLKKALIVCITIIMSSNGIVAHSQVYEEKVSGYLLSASENDISESETDIFGETSTETDPNETSGNDISESETNIFGETSTETDPNETFENDISEPETDIFGETSTETNPDETFERPAVPKSNQGGVPLSQLPVIHSNVNTPYYIGFFKTEQPYLIIITIAGEYTFSTFTHPEKFTFQQNGDLTEVFIDTHCDNPDGSKTAWVGGGFDIYIIGENFVTDGYCWKSIASLPKNVMDYCPELLLPLY